MSINVDLSNGQSTATFNQAEEPQTTPAAEEAINGEPTKEPEVTPEVTGEPTE